jgi:hypothetical protein
MPKHARHLNAARHGLRAASLVLPWEDPREFAGLREELAAEHAPQGPAETALVDELAGILWRLRRVHVAEAAAWRSGLRRTLARYNGQEELISAALPAGTGADTAAGALAVTGPEREVVAEARDARQVTAAARRALAILDGGGEVAEALAVLLDGTRDWWAEHVEGEDVEPDDPEALREFLTGTVLRWSQSRELVLTNREAVRAQAVGAAFDGGRLDLVGKYEVHLHRSLGRVLAMLVSLQERRKTVRAEVVSFGINGEAQAAVRGAGTMPALAG